MIALLLAVAISLEAETLPKGFAGHDIAAIYRQVDLRKDEFETTEQYRKRRSAIPTAIYAFPVTYTMIRYDADAARFDISLLLTFAEGGGMLTLDESVRGGVREKYGIFLPGRHFSIFNAHLLAEAERARALKEHLRVLLLARVGPESVAASSRRAGIHEHVLQAEPLGLWVYDARDGSILGKYDLTGAPLTPEGTVNTRALAADVDGLTAVQKMKTGMAKADIAALLARFPPTVAYEDDGAEKWTVAELGLTIVFRDGKLTSARSQAPK